MFICLSHGRLFGMDDEGCQIVQWQSPCLAPKRPWIRTPTPPQKEEKKKKKERNGKEIVNDFIVVISGKSTVKKTKQNRNSNREHSAILGHRRGRLCLSTLCRRI